jgi:WD domain, G-beta repeat.
MLAKSSMESSEPQNDQQGHPVIRTLYDHIEEVTCLEFHPSAPILASGSKDKTVKMFDYSKSSVRKAHKTIQVRRKSTGSLTPYTKSPLRGLGVGACPKGWVKLESTKFTDFLSTWLDRSYVCTASSRHEICENLSSYYILCTIYLKTKM